MKKTEIYLYCSWFIAIIATFGSLFFSEVMEFVPCTLCWYQRILMYPLSLLLIIGVLIEDCKVYFYTIPMTVIGLIFAGYHNLLQFGIIPEKMAPCVENVLCSTKYINWFGFISIPVLSFFAFFLILLFLFLSFRSIADEK